MNLQGIRNAHFQTFFPYVKRIRFSVQKRKKNGYANLVRFVCKPHPQFPYILFANTRKKQNNKIAPTVRMQRHRKSSGLIPIADSRLKCAPSKVMWSVDLLSNWFQIFLICSNLVDRSGHRYYSICSSSLAFARHRSCFGRRTTK